MLNWKRHLAYLGYLFRHKWYFLVASWRLDYPLLPALFHDLSKFRPSEWFPYAKTFYGPGGEKRYQESPDFMRAWNAHQKRNKHHWQCWVLLMDNGGVVELPMPERYIFEMVADWLAAGRAITGRWEGYGWYEGNKDRMRLHQTTRLWVEAILVEVGAWSG